MIPGTARWMGHLERAVRCGASFLALCALPSCGGPGPKYASPPDLPPTPLEGMILYHEPVQLQGVSKLRTTPVTQIYTTSRDESLAEDQPIHTFSGTVEGVGRGTPVSEQEMSKAIEKMLRNTHAGSTRVLSPAKFQTLWNNLEAAGLFHLPVWKGKGRPTDEPYFLVKSSGGTWIFQRPGLSRPLSSIPPRGTDPGKVDPALPLVKIWRDSKVAFFQFADSQ